MRWRVLAVVGVLAVVAAACGGGTPEGSPTTGEPTTGGATTTGPTPSATRTEDPLPQGGTLRLALQSDVSAAFDPQKEYYSTTWALYRCCLLRTLMSYNGKDSTQGGAEALPDLAAAAPEVSADGLTWTFRLKPGINYSPPLQDLTVTAGDIIRALEREACSQCAAGGYSFYFSVIEGFDEFADEEVESISGLSAPDDLTLEVQLTQPAGDMPFRFAMPASAPIPPNPDAPDARLGVAEGHETDYGRFLVATGPYMFEGIDEVDFSAPAGEQEPASGYVPGKSITLVRNPSWSKETDDLRLANVDRIETTITSASIEDLANQVDNGALDLVFDGVVPVDQLRDRLTNPDTQETVHSLPSDAVRYLSFNLAQPPFDDVNVRKAVNTAIDKDGLRELRGGAAFGDIAGHIIVDSLTGNELQGYDPYATESSQGDIEQAKDFMRESAYDTDGDGVCDAEECSQVLTVIDQAAPYPEQTRLIAQNLEPLGITLDIKSFERTTMYTRCNDPTAHVAFCPSPAWGKDYPDAQTFGPPLFDSESIGPDACCNYSLVGVSNQVLEDLNYEARDIPSVDPQLEDCTALTGEDRVTCWVELDRHLMEEIVPWVPYLFDKRVDITSTRVLNYQFDQFAGAMALDQIALDPAA